MHSGLLSLDQICDLITSSGLRPDSRVAWSTKLRLQMRNESYLEAVTTCFDAVKIFSNQGDVVFFLVHCAMAYLFLNKKSFAVTDFIAVCDKDFEAGLLLNTQALKNFILSLPENRKHLILATLEDSVLRCCFLITCSEVSVQSSS